MNNSNKIQQQIPPKNEDRSISTLRLYLLIALTLNLLVLIGGISAAHGVGSVLGFSGRMLLSLWPYFLLSIILTIAIGLAAKNSRWSGKVHETARKIINPIKSLGDLNWFLFAIPIAFYAYFILAGVNVPVMSTLAPIWVFGHLGLIGALFLSGTRNPGPKYSLLVTYSIYGLVLWVINYVPDVHIYPLALGWSETSRYYYASLFFSPLVYGEWFPLSSLHPTRYMLQSLPFIVPTLPLWFHRLWQVLLWLGVTAVGGWALSRRIKPKNRWIALGLMSWFSLFTFQGPVYYHLMVVVIIVLLGFDKDRLWRSLIFVAAASLWAGISRVNWFPVAGMLAVTLYVLEQPKEKKNFWQYWRWPVLAVLLGFGLAFVSQAVYAVISNNPPEVFASSFNSPLFFYRLFPNQAFGPGVINMTMTAIFPLLAIVLWRVIPKLRTWWTWRLLGLFTILAVLLVVGFIVSTKIGGGDNLHNMDSFLVVMAVVAAYIGFGRFAPDHNGTTIQKALPTPFIILVFLIPLVFVLDMLRPYPNLDNKKAWEDIQTLQALIDKRVPEDGEVLFIQNRHLLTFDLIEGVRLVPEYEKVFLMEMAMSGNQDYLNNFYRDLENHRFDLIVSEPLALITRPASDVFGEENNVWVERVAEPLVETYHSVFEFSESGMSIFAPTVE